MPSVFSCHGSFSKLPPKESEKKLNGMTLWHHLLSMIGASLENASKITSAHHIDRNFAKQVNSRCWWDYSPKITWYNCCWRVWLRTNKKIERQQGRTALCFGPKGFACICTSATFIYTVLTFDQSHFICNLFSITSFWFCQPHIEHWTIDFPFGWPWFAVVWLLQRCTMHHLPAAAVLQRNANYF